VLLTRETKACARNSFGLHAVSISPQPKGNHMKKIDTRAALLVALDAYSRDKYGVPIEKYSAAWLGEPDGGTRYPWEALDLVHVFNGLNEGTI
jgi:hypothetical protein